MLHLEEKRCQKCGNILYPTSSWALKDKYGYYCKPSCYLHRNEGRKPQGTKKRKPILQYTKNGEFVKEYNSGEEAARALDVTVRDIYKTCKGDKATAFGFVWKWKEDVDLQNECDDTKHKERS